MTPTINTQVEATLALAYEQRTANLLTYMNLVIRTPSNLPTENRDAWIARTREVIEERLKLT